MDFDDIIDWVVKGIAALVVAFLVIALPFILYNEIQETKEWKSWCTSQGGHVSKDTDTISTGKTTTSDTDYFCITSDGKLIGFKD